MKLLFKKGKFNLLIAKVLDYVATLDDEVDYVLTIDKVKAKRSNDANRYFWSLVGELSAKINVSPEEIYRTYIRDIGGNYEIVPIRNDAVEVWIKNWRNKGIGWQCDIIGESKLKGYTNVICYYGSSTYTTQQFSRLVNMCVDDCKANGIETMTDAELASMIKDYKEN